MDADQTQTVEEAIEATADDHPLWWQWWLSGDLREAPMCFMPFMDRVLKQHLANQGIVNPEQLYNDFVTQQGYNDVDGYAVWLNVNVSNGQCQETAGKVAHSLDARYRVGNQPATDPPQPPSSSPAGVVPDQTEQIE